MVLSMIIGAQMRAGRAALNWSIENLAEKCGVSARTIKRLEAVDGVPSSRAQTLLHIQAALEAGGIEFIGTSTHRPGIRLLVAPNSGK
jgi:transcriptional regulator with XRE-family HTH domain